MYLRSCYQETDSYMYYNPLPFLKGMATPLWTYTRIRVTFRKVSYAHKSASYEMRITNNERCNLFGGGKKLLIKSKKKKSFPLNFFFETIFFKKKIWKKKSFLCFLNKNTSKESRITNFEVYFFFIFLFVDIHFIQVLGKVFFGCFNWVLLWCPAKLQSWNIEVLQY